MLGRPQVSVCMATFNGAEYVESQIKSMSSQLAEVDEIIIVDDASTDGTPEIVTGLEDLRIRLFRNPTNIGYVRTAVS